VLYDLRTNLPVGTYILVIAPCYPSAIKHLSLLLLIISRAWSVMPIIVQVKMLTSMYFPSGLSLLFQIWSNWGNLLVHVFCVGLIKWY